uniref:AMP-dependent synthetase/ligase domain-containing protein n=1 Tax=Clastoptera arizonana TaxID=38151 RepID=A0A1B6D9Q1_9HEMI
MKASRSLLQFYQRQNIFLSKSNEIKHFYHRRYYSSFLTSREIMEYKSPSEIKSPYKHLEIKNVSVIDFIWKRLDKFPDKIAIECGLSGRKYTFAEIKHLSQKFAIHLANTGYYTGQTIALITENCPEYPIILYGCLEAGLTVTLVSYLYGPAEVSHQLKNSDAVCVITSFEKLHTVQKAINETHSQNKKDIKIIVLDINNIHLAPITVGRFSEFIYESHNLSLLKNDIDTNNIALLPYSSGTTGLPKGVRLTHRNIVSNLQQFLQISPIKETTEDHQDVIPLVLPLYHMYGLSIMNKSFCRGSKIVTLPKFDPKSFLNTLKSHKCSILFLVPPIIIFLGGNETTSEHLQHVHTILSAAAPVGPKDLEKCLVKIPKENNASYIQAYGLTEATACLTCTDKSSNLSSSGPPVPNTFIKVISVENGNILGPYKDGEICSKGPQVSW